MLPIFRCYLHHHGILIHCIVDGGNLALSERIVQRVIDGARQQSETAHRQTINLEIGL